MERTDVSSTKKALQVNLDDSIYGTFAEIGAGQEVARHFFQAGRASNTIAKTISAYDMTFSDEIYGKESRYVCEARLLKMLDYEFKLLQERLHAQRGSSTRFFAFADTVATGSTEQSGASSKSHGWMGIRFQSKSGGGANDIILHVKLWDRFRLAQQEALGILGVNLIHSAFFPAASARERIAALLDNLSPARIEVNMIRFRGPDLEHLDNRLMNLELVQQRLTDAVLFGQKGETVHASDSLFKCPIFVQRGTFRPVTKVNIDILERGFAQFKKHPLCKGDAKVLFEITMSNLDMEASGNVNQEDFLHRVDSLGALGHQVLISNFNLFYQMKSYLRQITDQLIGVVVGASHLEKMFDAGYYKELPGGILEGMSRLFDDNTRLFSFPFKSEKICMTAKSFHPGGGMEHLYKHLLANDFIVDISGCDDVDTSIHSRDVRKMMESGDPKWKTLVPAAVSKVIEERQLFGMGKR